MRTFFLLLLVFFHLSCQAEEVPSKVILGIDQLFTVPHSGVLKGRRVGLITNHTAIDSKMRSSIDLFKCNAKSCGYTLKALFAPEHGLRGADYAADAIKDGVDADGIPIFSLHGETRRPTPDMLKQIDVLVYDIQDVGARSYTYASTLFYAMEEAAKKGIPVVVLDRPNPINGITIDGPMLEEPFRSFVGYINVPYCHGMTIGELARFFNEEYNINCKLHVVPMKGWKRSMSFSDTGLAWIPTSPNVPESDTPLYYPTTGILGELQIISIGVGYTLPFKVVGAPWIDANRFAQALNSQNFPGVTFHPFYFRPFFGRYAKETCQGVLIVVTDPKRYLPVSTQYLLLGTLKNLYPSQFSEALTAAKDRKTMFCNITGTEKVYSLLQTEKSIIWKLREIHQKEREQFAEKRKKHLIPSYL